MSEHSIALRSFVKNRLMKSWRASKCASRMHSDRKSTRLNSSHSQISYAVFCLKKKKSTTHYHTRQVGDPRLYPDVDRHEKPPASTRNSPLILIHSRHSRCSKYSRIPPITVAP